MEIRLAKEKLQKDDSDVLDSVATPVAADVTAQDKMPVSPSQGQNPAPASKPEEDIDILDELFKEPAPQEAVPTEATPEVKTPEKNDTTPATPPVDDVTVEAPQDTVAGDEVDAVLKEIENLVTQAQESSKEADQVIQKSDLTDNEKQDLLNKLNEKDQLLSEIQIQQKALQDRYNEKVAETENYKLDMGSNKKYMDKFENDPDVQEYVSLKMRLDNWDEKVTPRLENFYKEQLSKLGYDIDGLIADKKKAEKIWLSQTSTNPWPVAHYEKWAVEEMDALESL